MHWYCEIVNVFYGQELPYALDQAMLCLHANCQSSQVDRNQQKSKQITKTGTTNAHSNIPITLFQIKVITFQTFDDENFQVFLLLTLWASSGFASISLSSTLSLPIELGLTSKVLLKFVRRCCRCWHRCWRCWLYWCWRCSGCPSSWVGFQRRRGGWATPAPSSPGGGG